MIIEKLKLLSIFGKDRKGLYIGDLAYELANSYRYALRQGLGNPYKNVSSSWTWKRRSDRFYLNLEKEPNPHALIVGSSGYGKSTLLKRILHEIEKNKIPAILLDAHNEHEDMIKEVGGKVYDASRHGINIFSLDGLTVEERSDSIARLLARVYGLGYLQEFSLRQCINYMYRKSYNKIAGKLEHVPNMHDLTREIDIFVANSKSMSETNRLKHIRSRISLLEGKSFFSDSKGIDDLMGSVSSFSLAAIHGEEAKTIYIHELLERLYRGIRNNAREEGIRLYLIIDEGDFLVERGYQSSGVMARLIAEGRKYGLGVIIASHSAAKVRSEIAGNVSTIISFRLKDPSDINYTAGIMAGGSIDKADAIKAMLGRLGQHSAMLVNYAVKAPVVFKTSRFDLGGMALANSVHSKSEIDNFILIEARKPIKFDALESKVDAAFGREGLAEMGKLMESKALKSFDADDGTWVGIKPNPGLEHETMLLKIQEKLIGMGVKSYILDNAANPDMVMRIENKRVALEYETGKKGVGETRGMLSRRMVKYDAVLIVTNEQSYKKYVDIAKGLGNNIHVCLYNGINADLLKSLIEH